MTDTTEQLGVDGPAQIYLAPSCSDERSWCEANEWDTGDCADNGCDRLPVKYIRHDLAAAPVSLEEIVEVLRKIDDIDPMELNLNNYNDDDVAQLSANASYVAVQIRSILSRLEKAQETQS